MICSGSSELFPYLPGLSRRLAGPGARAASGRLGRRHLPRLRPAPARHICARPARPQAGAAAGGGRQPAFAAMTICSMCAAFLVQQRAGPDRAGHNHFGARCLRHRRSIRVGWIGTPTNWQGMSNLCFPPSCCESGGMAGPCARSGLAQAARPAPGLDAPLACEGRNELKPSCRR